MTYVDADMDTRHKTVWLPRWIPQQGGRVYILFMEHPPRRMLRTAWQQDTLIHLVLRR